MRSLIYISLLFLSITSNSFSQPMSFISDLDKAIGLSKKNNLPLLIYRYDEKDLNWAKSNN